MENGLIVQVLSSFTANLLGPPLQRALASAGLAYEVAFTAPAMVREYMLAPASNTEGIVGTLVLSRVEDWLRDGLPCSVGRSRDAWARQELQRHLREFVSELTILCYRGKPAWFLACPSAGWTSAQGNWAALCRTYTNVLVARVREIPQAFVLSWPATLAGANCDDRHSDELGKVPYTQQAFDRLGEIVAGQIARTLTQGESSAASASAGSPELAAFLADLLVHVKLAPAHDAERPHVDRIIRTAASFSLAGEKPYISDAEVDALLKSKSCLLVSVSDRLANHGPSGVVVCSLNGNALVVEAMSLSCTVLGKQVEYAVLSALGEIATERHCSKLVFEYTPSGRNEPILRFLQSFADRETSTRFMVPLDLTGARIRAAAVNPDAWRITRAA
jgi:hypothetical protein